MQSTKLKRRIKRKIKVLGVLDMALKAKVLANKHWSKCLKASVIKPVGNRYIAKSKEKERK